MGLVSIVSSTIIGWSIGIVTHFVSVFTGANEQQEQKECKKMINQ